MPKAKLTKRLIDSLDPEEKDFVYWDSEIPGLGLKVTPKGKRYPNGRKVFILKYRNEKGTQ